MHHILKIRFLALGLIFIGLILTGSGMAYALVTQKISNPAPAPLPSKLAGLPLSSKSSGSQAVVEVSHLHNQVFPLTSASVGRYGSNQSITIWTTGAPFRFLANRMLVDMRNKIDEVDTPFIPLGDRRDTSRVVYELQGLGQKHFYFQSGNLIVWMAVDEQFAEQALIELLVFYP
jgi:hypothetical protein